MCRRVVAGVAHLQDDEVTVGQVLRQPVGVDEQRRRALGVARDAVSTTMKMMPVRISRMRMSGSFGGIMRCT